MKRLELFFWACLPCAITLLLALFTLAPKPLPGLDMVSANLVLMPVFFWGLNSPRDMPYWFLFALGLVIDAVQGLPLGLTPLAAMLLRLLADWQRKYILKEGFVVKWGYFALLLAGVSLAQWMVLAAAGPQMPRIAAPLIQYALSLCLYPFFHRLFDALHEQAKHRRKLLGVR